MRKLYYIIPFFLLSLPLAAQKRIKIEGSVWNADLSKPIQGASVLEINTRTRMLTDEAGRFLIEANMGDTLRINALGYKLAVYPLDADNARKMHHKIVLQVDNVLLGEVKVKPGVLKPDKIVSKPETGLPPGLIKASLLGSPLTYFYNIYSKEAKQRKKLQKLRREKYLEYLQKEKAYYNSFFLDNKGYE